MNQGSARCTLSLFSPALSENSFTIYRWARGIVTFQSGLSGWGIETKAAGARASGWGGLDPW
jgi:hypothetical protein